MKILHSSVDKSGTLHLYIQIGDDVFYIQIKKFNAKLL